MSEKPELLIRVDERTERLEKWVEMHTSHHSRLSMAFVSTAISIILAQAGMIFALIKLAGA